MTTGKIPTFDADQFEKVNYGVRAERQDLEKMSFNHFEIHRIEEHKGRIRFPLLPHRKTINDFIYLTSGSVVRSKGLEVFEFQANQLFFLPAHTITSTHAVSNDAEGIYCHFSDELLNNNPIREFSLFDISTCPIVTVPEVRRELILSFLNRLLEIEPNRKDLQSLYIQLFVSEVYLVYEPHNRPSKNSALLITEKFKKTLLQSIYQNQTVASFAELLNITPNHLNKCVKAATNKSAQDWINDMIILEAKVLLRQSNMTISEIAFELTNQDVSDFGRFFKNKIGLTPKEFRDID